MPRWRWALVAGAVLAVAPAPAEEGPGKASARPAPTTTFRDPTTGTELLYVEGGCFQMGDVFGDGEEEEAPVHEVCVDAFYIGKFEVTQGQWKTVMGSNPSRDAGCKGDDACPVDSVSWSDAQDFIARLNGKGGGGKYRLPTEAEWEYAARSGGKRERYSGGNDVGHVAWFAENSGKRNHPVGTKAANGLGIHDMSGNVWEWTNDWYAADYYSSSPRSNPAGPGGPAGPNVDRVIRGGCKTGEASNERTARRSYGYQRTSGDRGDKIGFRLVWTP
jgi:formylglycine-generating enzyme required for sulfatase activity